MSRVLTFGTFDLVHASHIWLFQVGARMGELVVVVNTDEFVERYKGARPVMSLDERMRTIRMLGYEVEVNWGCESIRPVLEKWKPDFILHGNDWMDESLYKQWGVSEDYLISIGAVPIYVPYSWDWHKEISSSKLKKRVRDSNNNASKE